MAKLETDFSKFTGAHVFYAFVPFESNTGVQGRKGVIDGAKTNLHMSLRHAMISYAIKSADRVIGYIDDIDNMCYILSNSNNDIGYNGTVEYQIKSSNYNNTNLEYKAQTPIERNIASGMIEYVSGKDSGGSSIISTIPCMDLQSVPFDDPTYTSYNQNT